MLTEDLSVRTWLLKQGKKRGNVPSVPFTSLFPASDRSIVELIVDFSNCMCLKG